MAFLLLQFSLFAQPEPEEEKFRGKVKSVSETGGEALDGNVTYTDFTFMRLGKDGKPLEIVKRMGQADTLFHTIYVYDSKGNKAEEKGRGGKTIYKYDASNRVKEEIEYDLSGNEERKVVYTYNAAGWKTKAEFFRNEGLWYTREYTYTDKGKLASYVETESGIRVMEVQYSWDASNNLIEEAATFPSPEMDYKVNMSYNKHGEWIESRRWSSDNGVTVKTTADYDEMGNQVKYVEYDSKDKPELRITHEFEYDTKGNWIKMSVFQNSNLISVSERTIEYY